MTKQEQRIAEARMQMTNRYLCMIEVQALCGIKPSTVYSLIKRGKFPKPMKIGNKSSRWPEKQLREWLDSQPREIGEPPD